MTILSVEELAVLRRCLQWMDEQRLRGFLQALEQDEATAPERGIDVAVARGLGGELRALVQDVAREKGWQL